jgi:hypothetical protein
VEKLGKRTGNAWFELFISQKMKNRSKKPHSKKENRWWVNIGEREKETIGYAVLRSRICVRGAARSNCHTLTMSIGTPGDAPTASMPAAGRRH